MVVSSGRLLSKNFSSRGLPSERHSVGGGWMGRNRILSSGFNTWTVEPSGRIVFVAGALIVREGLAATSVDSRFPQFSVVPSQ